jgi:hypothetical protein
MPAVFLLMPFPSNGSSPDKVREGLQVFRIGGRGCLVVHVSKSCFRRGARGHWNRVVRSALPSSVGTGFLQAS